MRRWLRVVLAAGVILAEAIHAGSAFADSLTLDGTVPLPAVPRLIAVNGVTHHAYVAVGNSYVPSSYYVSAVSGTTHVADIPVGAGDWSTGPIFIAANEATNRVYVNHTGANFANAINGSTNTVIASFGTGAYPEGIVTDPLTNRLYIANTNNGNVSVINTTGDANTLVTTISIPGAGAGITNLYLAIVPPTSRLYVTAPALHKVFIVDTASNSVIGNFPVTGSPRFPVVNPVTNKLYLTLDGDPHVLVLNASTGATVASVPLSGPAQGLAVNPTLNHVYATTTGVDANKLTVINGATDTVAITSGDLGSALLWVGADTSNGQVYIVTTANMVAVLTASGAGTFTVNSAADTVDASPGDGICADGVGNCTLRAAIMEANALSSADTITLPTGIYTLTIPGTYENVAATGDLDITGNLTINGAGAASTIIQACDASANPSCVGIDRVFDVLDAASLTLNGLTIRNGYAASEPFGRVGGGIRVGTLLPWEGGSGTNSSLVLNDSRVLNNTASGHGGGISNIGMVTVNNSVIAGNQAASTYSGGGILNNLGGSLTMTNSTISGNAAAGGGGIFNNPGSLPATITVTNSTISGNTATVGYGGGLFQNAGGYFGPVSLTNTTVTANQAAGSGGGLFIAGSLTLKNSIVGGNVATVNPDCSGTVASQGHNLIQDPAGCSGLGGSDLTNTDSKLGPLADNGGPTETHALLVGSPAIDAVPLAFCTVSADQRGITRPQGIDCDIGAFEGTVAPPDTTPPTITVPGPITTEAIGPSGAVVTYTVTATDDVDGPVAASCVPASGSTFPIGASTVTCTASDAAGNTATATFTVTVQDTTPPVIGPMSNLTVDATSPAGAVVVFALPAAVDAVDPSPTVTAVPASGGTFPVGTTTVTVTAADASSNSSSVSFTVTVHSPSQMTSNLILTVTAVFPQATNLLRNALNNLNAGGVGAACNQIAAFINQVQAQSGKKLTPSQASELIAATNRLRAALGC